MQLRQLHEPAVPEVRTMRIWMTAVALSISLVFILDVQVIDWRYWATICAVAAGMVMDEILDEVWR